jgi:hypothetical protein
MYAIIFLTCCQLPLEIDDTPELPSLSDLRRFPDGDTAQAQLHLYRKHLEWVEQAAQLPRLDNRFNADWWAAVRTETQRRMEMWEMLACAHGRPTAFRGWGVPPRVFLDQLRDRLGWEDYEAGRMPPKLPTPPVGVARQ